MTAIYERSSTLPWPPVIYVSATAAAMILHWLLPLPWIGRPLSEILFAVGWLASAAALALGIATARALARAKTTIRPDRGSEHLVTSGPFALSRNPIYLGLVLLMIGIGLITGIAWFLLLALVAGFVTQKLAVEREEKHLAARFGKKWRDYAKKVRRWI